MYLMTSRRKKKTRSGSQPSGSNISPDKDTSDRNSISENTEGPKKDLPLSNHFTESTIIRLPPVVPKQRSSSKSQPPPKPARRKSAEPNRIQLPENIKPISHQPFMMSDGEIISSFKQAKNQIAQIKILAELNATTPHMIKRILGLEE